MHNWTRDQLINKIEDLEEKIEDLKEENSWTKWNSFEVFLAVAIFFFLIR